MNGIWNSAHIERSFGIARIALEYHSGIIRTLVLDISRRSLDRWSASFGGSHLDKHSGHSLSASFEVAFSISFLSFFFRTPFEKFGWFCLSFKYFQSDKFQIISRWNGWFFDYLHKIFRLTILQWVERVDLGCDSGRWSLWCRSELFIRFVTADSQCGFHTVTYTCKSAVTDQNGSREVLESMKVLHTLRLHITNWWRMCKLCAANWSSGPKSEFLYGQISCCK